MNRQTVHFFWHGAITLYEYHCIKSFVKHEFEVCVWSFEKLNLPPGVIACDASEILPKSELHSFKVISDDGQHSQKEGGINSGFSDLFRYTLLLKHGGWWADADIVCLKNQQEFAEVAKGKQIVAGLENTDTLNGAILSFPSKEINQLALNKCMTMCQESRNFVWGAVGPLFITDFVKENNLHKDISQQHVFYPIHFSELNLYFDPDCRSQAQLQCQNSLTTHLFNWLLMRQIDKNKPPHRQSFLHSILLT